MRMIVRFVIAGYFFLQTIGMCAQIIKPPYEYGSYLVQQSERLLHEQLVYEAKRQLHTVSDYYPESPAADRVPLLLAESLVRTGEFSNADATLQSFIVSRPNSPLVTYALFKRGEIAFEQARYPAACEFFTQAVSHAEKDVQLRQDSSYTQVASSGLFWSGLALVQQGKYEEAQQPLLRCVGEYPANNQADDALFVLGQLAEQTNDNDKAITYFTRASREYPVSNACLASHIRAAQNYIIVRDPTNALSELEQAEGIVKQIGVPQAGGSSKYEQQSYVDNPAEQILYLRGEAHNAGGRYEQAVKAFEELLQKYPQSPLTGRAQLGAGWALLNLEQYSRSITYYDSALASSTLDPKLAASAKLYRIIGLKRSGQRKEAKDALIGLSVQPDYPLLGEALLELGQMHYEDSSLVDAQHALERAEKETTTGLTFIRIQLVLGAVLMEQGNYSKASKAYARAEDMAAKSAPRFMPNKNIYLAEARLKRGMALEAARNYPEAISVLNTFLSEHKDDSRTDEALFWLAESYFHADLMKNAAETYQQIIRNYSLSHKREYALYGLGWTEFRTKDFTKSSATFAQLLREFPKTEFALDVLTRKGDGHYLSQQYGAAADAYRQAARRAPETDQGQYAAYQLSQSLFRMGSYDESIAEMREFIKRSPHSSFADNAQYTIAWTRFQQKQYREAIEEFNSLLEKFPNTELAPRADYAIGDAYYNLGEYENAIASYRKITTSYPNSPYAKEAVNAIQYSLVLLGRDSEAVAEVDHYIEANPGSEAAMELRVGKGNTFYNGKKYKNAIAEYEDFIKKYPQAQQTSEALYWLGKSHIGLSESEKSIEDAQKARDIFEELIKKYPESPQAQQASLELALAHVQLNEPDKADSLFEVVKKKYADSAIAVRAGFEQAYLRETRGDTVRAMNSYRAIADRYRGTDYGDRSRYRIGVYYRSRDIYDSARAEFAQLTSRKDELGAEAQYRIGELWLRDKNYEKARDAFLVNKNTFSDYEDWYTLSLIGLGESYENLQEQEKAKEVYRLVVALRGEDDYAKTAQTRLERLTKSEKP